jgi:hypothetical protein
VYHITKLKKVRDIPRLIFLRRPEQVARIVEAAPRTRAG